MAFVRNNGQMPQKGTLAYYEKQSASARGSLFAILGLTIVNILIGIFSDSGTMFLFSSWLPLDLAYGVKEIYVTYDVFLTTAVVIAAVYLIALTLCAALWKKGIAASVMAAVLYFVDCVYVVPGLMGKGPGFYMPDAAIAIFHVLVMILLIVGVVNEAKAIKLRKEAAAAAPFAEQEQAAAQQGPEL